MEVTLQQIFELHNMTILSSCEMPSGTDWPTWVPDWSTRSKCLQQFIGLNAAGDTYPEIRRIGLNTLEVCGVFVDKIKNVFPLFFSHHYNSGNPHNHTRAAPAAWQEGHIHKRGAFARCLMLHTLR